MPFFDILSLPFSRLDASLQDYFLGLLWLTLLDTACLACGLKVMGIPRALELGFISAVLRRGFLILAPLSAASWWYPRRR